MKCDELTLYHSKSLNLPIYVASEVDAAIAELKNICKVHVEAIASMEAGLQQDGKEICHQKYKRCLAMAWWCHSMWVLLRDENETKKSVFYWRWWNLWYELAEKFKEAK